jgi:hypothetical protein
MSSRVGESMAVALAQRRADLTGGSRLVERCEYVPTVTLGLEWPSCAATLTGSSFNPTISNAVPAEDVEGAAR